jgi:hypothetical protein
MHYLCLLATLLPTKASCPAPQCALITPAFTTEPPTQVSVPPKTAAAFPTLIDPVSKLTMMLLVNKRGERYLSEEKPLQRTGQDQL